jgi:chloramphenicol-sensitive protein RarD
VTDQSTPDRRLAFTAALGAYTFWGLLPLYLKQVSFASPWEVLAQRVLWSVPAAILAVAFFGGFPATLKALRTKGVLPALMLSAVLIAANWTIFVWAVANARVIEGSLAYFITPLLGVAIGVAFFEERLQGLQAAALGVGAIGVIVQGVALGHIPWVSLALAATWSAYGVVRKQAPVPAAGGLLVETLLLAPAAGVLMVILLGQGPLAFQQSSAHAAMLVALGPFTAVPLILFAIAARRLSFIALSLLQYIGPSLQLLTGLAFGEPFTPLRGLSFSLIWVGLALFTWASARARKTA